MAPRFTAFYFTEDGTVPDELKALTGSLSASPVPFALIPLTPHLAPDAPGPTGWDHTGRLLPSTMARPVFTCPVRTSMSWCWRQAAPAEISSAIERTRP